MLVAETEALAPLALNNNYPRHSKSRSMISGLGNFFGRDVLSGDEALSYKFFRPSLIVPVRTFDYTHNVNNAFSITSLLRRRHSDASAVRAMEAARVFDAGVTQRVVNGSVPIGKPPEPIPSLVTPAFAGSPKLRHSSWLKIRSKVAPVERC